MGGKTERVSSSVTDSEKGLSHFQSLNHLASPLVLLRCTGGLCATGRKGLIRCAAWCTACCAASLAGWTGAGTGDAEKTMNNVMINAKSNAILTTLRRGGFPCG